MGLVSSKKSREELEATLTKAKEIASSTPVVVFSKTYCGYCKRVKQLLTQLGASHKVIELDRESDGSDIQSALAEWTGQHTVPNVFIGGKHIGGCDTVTGIHQAGKLVPLLKDAGAVACSSTLVALLHLMLTVVRDERDCFIEPVSLLLIELI